MPTEGHAHQGSDGHIYDLCCYCDTDQVIKDGIALYGTKKGSTDQDTIEFVTALLQMLQE